MNEDNQSRTQSEQDGLRKRLAELRVVLLALHKTLVDSERVSYEATAGSIQSSSQFLQLLTEDAWFAWLRPFSQLIVALDVAIEKREPLTSAAVDDLIFQTSRLLVASENGEGFPANYHLALQRDPDVVMAHAEVAKLIGPAKPSASDRGE